MYSKEINIYYALLMREKDVKKDHSSNGVMQPNIWPRKNINLKFTRVFWDADSWYIKYDV